MSLSRVLDRLRRERDEHLRGLEDGHEPTAAAHAVFARQLAEDIEAVENAEIDIGNAWGEVHEAQRARDEAVARAETTEAAFARLQAACLDVFTNTRLPRTKCRLCERVTLHGESPTVQHGYVWRVDAKGVLHREPCPLTDASSLDDVAIDRLLDGVD